MDRIEEFEKITGYVFKDKLLLRRAFTHSSYINEHRLDRNDCNERIEFLGDAVLELVSSEYLFKKYPEMPEGELTKLRASLVCEPTLAIDAKEISLSEFLILGKGEDKTMGRYRDSVVSDAMESVIGAIYLDGGLKPARKFILRFVLNDIESKQLYHDAKTALQEIIQNEYESAPVYTITGESGPDHNKSFCAEVSANGKVIGKGEGRTKKGAEQQAAFEALKHIKESGK